MKPFLELKNLSKTYGETGRLFTKGGVVQALHATSLTIEEAMILGVVGESGCGKSTLGQCILRLIQPTTGQVFFRGRDLFSLSKQQFKPFRREMQIIFQNPYACLNPRMKVMQLLQEPLLMHEKGLGKAEIRDRVKQMAELVGLKISDLVKYPHEFSGGQRQRIAIARALILKPAFVVCDEPVAALDASIQSQIINLMLDLQERFDLTYLFISHDLNVVQFLCTHVAVMYLGSIVERTDIQTLFNKPAHPYTRALLSAIPTFPRKAEIKPVLLGEVPSHRDALSGCLFFPRCPERDAKCLEGVPALRDVGKGHFVACISKRGFG